MDWFDELEMIVDTPAREISSKLKISEEAANHLLQAVDSYLVEESGGDGEGNGGVEQTDNDKEEREEGGEEE